MYCPKCGQQQASDEVRFCSRCGFQLGVVTALIATGGVPPAVIIDENRSKTRLLLQRRTRQGAKAMFASGVLLPVAMMLSIPLDSPFPLIFPFIIFLAGLAWMLYFRLFGEDFPNVYQKASHVQLTGARDEFLSSPPLQIPSFKPSQSTAEIVQPSSVTEHTTKLLDES